EAIIHHRFDCYKPAEGEVPRRKNGVLVSQVAGSAVAYALWKLQHRAQLGHGQLVGFKQQQHASAEPIGEG
ncbi:MAG: hypothetical protein IH848_06735, partial [Acidobacteria bacterium]|nr:hypothetical protein [Acidobacteriota bacterium]